MRLFYFLYAAVAATLITFTANAQVPQLEELEFAVCKGPGVVFYFTNLSDVQDQEVGYFERFRNGHFVFQASNPEESEDIFISSHGVGKLHQALTKRIIFEFDGEGAFSHLPDVKLTLHPTSENAGFGTVVVKGQSYKNLSCRLGVL